MKTLSMQYQDHKGGLIKLKSQLFWGGGSGSGRHWDGIPERICLILDVHDEIAHGSLTASASTNGDFDNEWDPGVTVLLLVDGSPHWVLVYETDMEFITKTQEEINLKTHQ
jgi:hypothetical protein